MRKIKICCVILIFTAFACREVYDTRLKVNNNTNESIFVAISKDSLIEHAQQISYDGTSEKYNFTRDFTKQTLSELELYGSDAWPRFVKSSLNEQMYFFVIDSTVIQHNKWEIICRKKLYSKSKFSLTSLNRINWTVNIDSLLHETK